MPADLEASPLPEGVRNASGIRIDKLLAKVGLADSVTDATRKIKAGAVSINGDRVTELVLPGSGRGVDHPGGQELAPHRGLKRVNRA